MQTFKALGALLDYPTPALIEALPEIERCLVIEGLVDGLRRQKLGRLTARLRDRDLLDLQEEWVELFDRTRRLALHLHEHSFGESRDRGQAMVDLATTYRLHGLELAVSETPDYLPLFCEFLAQLPPGPARRYLADAVEILALLAERLATRGSPYAAVPAALAALAGRAPETATLAALREAEPHDPDTPEALDAAWEETPVEFTGTSTLASCPFARMPARQGA